MGRGPGAGRGYFTIVCILDVRQKRRETRWFPICTFFTPQNIERQWYERQHVVFGESYRIHLIIIQFEPRSFVIGQILSGTGFLIIFYEDNLMLLSQRFFLFTLIPPLLLLYLYLLFSYFFGVS